MTIEITAVDSGAPAQSRTEPIVLSVAENKFPWQNPANPLDTNHDGFVSPLDALVGVNLLNEISSPLLDSNRKLRTSRPASSTFAYYDTNGDGFLSPLDVLIVVNYLNSRISLEGEDESAITAVPSSFLADDTLQSTIVEPAPRRASVTSLEQPAAPGNNDDYFRIVGEREHSVRPGTQVRSAEKDNFSELLDTLAADIAPRWRL